MTLLQHEPSAQAPWTRTMLGRVSMAAIPSLPGRGGLSPPCCRAARRAGIRMLTAPVSVVLVHGAWADSSSWVAVVTRRQRDGHTVYVPPNPLLGLSYDPAFLRD